jgi:hypothetical protein
MSRRGWLLTAAGVLLLFVVLGLIEAFTPAPQGPAGSSYATSARGAAAWAQLLGQDGHPVTRLRTPLDRARLAPGETLVVIGARTLTGSTGVHLRRFVSGGGRLVLAGSGRSVARAVSGAGTPPRATRIAVHRLGSGRVELLAHAAPLENAGLAHGADALLALRLAGPRARPVAFAEALHGYTAATGLAAFPARWWVTIVGLALAAGAWALSKARRLGPAEATSPAPVPPRAAYVDAMARALTAGPPHRRTAHAVERETPR